MRFPDFAIKKSKTVNLFVYGIITALIFISIMPQSSSASDFSGSVYNETGYDDNIFRMETPAASSYNNTSLMLSYSPESSYWGADYNGDVQVYSAFPGSYSFIHSLGFYYSLPLDTENTNNIDFYSSALARLDGSDLKAYDNYQALGNLSFNHSFSESMSGDIGYQARYRSYTNLSFMSYVEHSAFVMLKSTFETRTSISAKINIGYKGYLENYTDTLINRQIIHRPGRGMPTVVDVPVYISQDHSSSQLTATLKVGQSLGEKTGISLGYTQRWNLGQPGRNIVDGSFVNNGRANSITGENDLFDDPYSYQSNELTAGLTSILPLDFKAKLTLSYYRKNYSQPGAIYVPVNEPEEGMSRIKPQKSTDSRLDDLTGIGFSLQKKFDMSWLIFNGLTIGFEYYYTGNNSNLSAYRVYTRQLNPMMTQSFYSTTPYKPETYSSNSFSINLSTDF